MDYEQNTQSVASQGATSTSLLARVKSREAEAWHHLVELYAPLVYQWCRQSHLQAADAADVGQDVFAAVNHAVGGFRRERPRDSFRGWLWTITRNKIYDHFRKRKDQMRGSGGTDAQQRMAAIPDQPPTATTTADGRCDNALERRALALVRAGVEERTWQAFVRVTVDGCTPAEVAKELQMSVSSVYVAIHRVRQKFREELEGLMD